LIYYYYYYFPLFLFFYFSPIFGCGIKNSDATKFLQLPGDGTQLTVREEMETQLIRSLISSYFHIVRQSIQDIIPKAIMHFLVNHTAQQVQNRLVASLYKPELFADMLNEDEGLVAERTRVKALLDAYKEAFKTLSDVSLKST